MTDLPNITNAQREQTRRITELKLSLLEAISDADGNLTTSEILKALGEVQQAYLSDCLKQETSDEVQS